MAPVIGVSRSCSLLLTHVVSTHGAIRVDPGLRPALQQQTGGRMTGGHVDQRRPVADLARRDGDRTAWVEAAAFGRIDRVRHVADEHLPHGPSLRIRYRN